MAVPQAGVQLPILFYANLPSLSNQTPIVSMVSYADDCTVFSFGVNSYDISPKITNFLVTIVNFFRKRNSRLSTPKSLVSILTTWRKEVR